ncbi:unnamed protein product [Clavelina lepadiformis]|uniref:Protein kinase domain-containing protein n=2 Tax=Clavelina lepadiformis TaxID=159417 RepID=A0ABP0H160_CLALP
MTILRITTSLIVSFSAVQCVVGQNENMPDLTAAMVVFLVLFLLCIPVIVYLAYKLRKYKLLYQIKQKHPYTISQHEPQHKPQHKYDDIGCNNSAFRDDASSIKSSVTYKRSLESLTLSQLMKGATIDDDIPHIAPMDSMGTKRVTKVLSHNDISGIVPYPSNSSIQDWNTEDVQHTLNLTQIRVENWLREEKGKKCGVGEVDLGKPTPCFVKILRSPKVDKFPISDDIISMNRLLNYKTCDNPNLVKFYGSCLLDDSLYLVSEFISSRDLRNVLLSSRTLDHAAVISTLSGAQLLKFVMGIADGLVYLHGNDVVHGALCARSILISDRLVPKISECCGENSKRLKLKSLRWAAPECFTTLLYSEMADVWSFGVVVWEILSLGGTPFNELMEKEVSAYVQRQLRTGGSVLPVTR